MTGSDNKKEVGSNNIHSKTKRPNLKVYFITNDSFSV